MIQEYVQMIERLQKENSDFKFKLEFKDKEIQQYKEQIQEFQAK